jgi:hypothetical protein
MDLVKEMKGQKTVTFVDGTSSSFDITGGYLDYHGEPIALTTYGGSVLVWRNILRIDNDY